MRELMEWLDYALTPVGKAFLLFVMMLPLALFLLLALCSGALAHGEAEWVMNTGLDCCGPEDCHRAPPGAWVRIGSGFFNAATNEWVPEDETQSSIDQDYWECRANRDLNVPSSGGKCLFIPSIGF